jgi:uncharacterized membrane protein YhaH (DUF805 family)
MSDQYQPVPHPAAPAPGAGFAPSGAVPLWAPLYGASFGAAISRFFRKYADFTGRASRSEYWWWMLFYVLTLVVGEVLALAIGSAGATVDDEGRSIPGPFFWVIAIVLFAWILGTLVPHLALVWRRLHDANFAGPFFFLGFIPFVGGIIVLILTLLPSNPEGARFDQPRA